MRALSKIPQIDQLVPFVTGASTGAAGQVSRAVTASVPGAQYLSASVMGTTANFPAAAQKSVSQGAFFTQQQSESGANVVVIGPLIATALYGPDPSASLGKRLRINHTLFRVIGVMESFGATSDNVIIMPVRVARSGVFGYGYGGDEISGLYIKAISTLEVKNVENQVYEIMRHQHNVRDSTYDDFQVQDLGSRLSTFTNLISLIAGFVPAIAAISLLVGGIGVLNIMLVSVTDRTREIGTRKAVGASDSAILVQFIMEATTLRRPRRANRGATVRRADPRHQDRHIGTGWLQRLPRLVQSGTRHVTDHGGIHHQPAHRPVRGRLPSMARRPPRTHRSSALRVRRATSEAAMGLAGATGHPRAPVLLHAECRVRRTSSKPEPTLQAFAE